VAQKFHFVILQIEVTHALRGLSAIAELLMLCQAGDKQLDIRIVNMCTVHCCCGSVLTCTLCEMNSSLAALCQMKCSCFVYCF